MLSNVYISPLLTSEDIADLCFSKFKFLPKTGKPKDTEWTVLAGVVLCNSVQRTNEVISLGCGTKCIGKSKLCPKGLILNDSHAEVLARRALLRYFYFHIKNAITDAKDDSSIFEWLPERNKCKLKDGLSLHFFSTQTPCGDACIISPNVDSDGPLDKRRKLDETEGLKDLDSGKIDEVYTGAKLIGTNHDDLMEQIIGAVRIKPGRGERTLSMSCSDKIAKWQIMGLQGALLDLILCEPIYFQTLDFCAGELTGIERAVWKRFERRNISSKKYRLHVPHTRICNSTFQHTQETSKQPSPNGLAWCKIPEQHNPYETSVNGKRQGVTRKTINTPSAALSIARYHLFKEFVDIIKLKPSLLADVHDLESKTYLEVKLMASAYQKAWNEVKAHYFLQWTSKPIENLKFTIVKEDMKEKSLNKKIS